MDFRKSTVIYKTLIKLWICIKEIYSQTNKLLENTTKSINQTQ